MDGLFGAVVTVNNVVGSDEDGASDHPDDPGEEAVSKAVRHIVLPLSNGMPPVHDAFALRVATGIDSKITFWVGKGTDVLVDVDRAGGTCV